MAKSDDDYEVGYGRPPKASQFQKGQSGNPKGRPKGKRNFLTLLEEALDEPVTITENGQRKVILKRQAIAKQMVNKAVSGDLKAVRALASLLPPGLSRNAHLEDEAHIRKLREAVARKLGIVISSSRRPEEPSGPGEGDLN